MCSWAMRKNVLGPFRSRVAGGAEGRVLVIGIGSWLNLPLYDGAARCVIGIGESLFGSMRQRIRRRNGSHSR